MYNFVVNYYCINKVIYEWRFYYTLSLPKNAIVVGLSYSSSRLNCKNVKPSKSFRHCTRTLTQNWGTPMPRNSWGSRIFRATSFRDCWISEKPTAAVLESSVYILTDTLFLIVAFNCWIYEFTWVIENHFLAFCDVS